MKESDNQNISKLSLKHIAIAIIFVSGISIITSYITVKTIVPTLSTPIPTSTILATIQPSPTLYVLQPATPDASLKQRPQLRESLLENDGFEVDSNLLQNSSFENDLSGWEYTDDSAAINIFETKGVNGKGFCSRREIVGWQTEFLNREWVGFSQKIQIDPNQDYFFSAWMKLNESRNILVYARFYNDSKAGAIQYLFGNHMRTKQDGETSDGWFFIHNILDPTPLNANYVEINFVHDKINLDYDTAPMYSTFCVDDVFLGKIVK